MKNLLTTLLVITTTCLSAKSDYLVIYTGIDTGYLLEVTEGLTYSFSSNLLRVNSPVSDCAISVDDVKSIRYSPDKVPLEVESVKIDDPRPLISYDRGILSVKSEKPENTILICDVAGSILVNKTFRDSISIDVNELDINTAIISVNGKYSLKVIK